MYEQDLDFVVVCGVLFFTFILLCGVTESVIQSARKRRK